MSGLSYEVGWPIELDYSVRPHGPHTIEKLSRADGEELAKSYSIAIVIPGSWWFLSYLGVVFAAPSGYNQSRCV